MKKTVGMLLLSVVAIASNSSNATPVAHNHSEKAVKLCDFAPKNNFRMPVGKKSEGIDEKTFNNVIDNLSSFYAPIIKKLGGTLKVNRKWTDETVNASAERQGNTWVLNMYGGLARFKGVTADGFGMVMCHELGHHLGGYPRIASIFGSNWASNEGQADYFATMKCFRRVMDKEDNASVINTMEIPKTVAEKCAEQHKSAEEISLCKRGSMAGLVLANLLNTLGQGTSTMDFDTPDTSEVSRTNDAHPKAQCRLDTYFNGAICGVAFSEDFAKDNPTDGACAEERGDSFGVRSRCWYKPKN